ncbi:pyridoxamine 5'-phosphate oxidase family protein [Peptoniphilus timonensis]|uniref:pyridoxamine 5'-phosphate oxidase family protein n=1 Tax=Peptoniphilus timonensis TaxID=1268254 RepID=UPI0002EB1788|nr:pyridoxamine 5'-phosphate oxidase family protein [Peptoniphilus timonensis]
MNKIYDYLKKVGVFYLATIDNDQARVRPLGALAKIEDKIYIVTSKEKEVYKQIKKNPKVEISAFDGKTWIRLSAVLEEDDRKEVREEMINQNKKALENMYYADDGKMTVLYLKEGKAVFSTFAGDREVVEI